MATVLLLLQVLPPLLMSSDETLLILETNNRDIGTSIVACVEKIKLIILVSPFKVQMSTKGATLC